MKLSKMTRTVCAYTMALWISPIPGTALAETLNPHQGMISTTRVLTEATRSESENEVRDYLKDNQVRNELLKRGVSPDEVSARLATLSDQELRSLSGQVQQARAGGDILVAVLLIVLIIFFAKRI